MGLLYEIATTIPAFAMPAYYDTHPCGRTGKTVIIPFGDDRQQHCTLWMPDQVVHDEVVFYFHGGGYIFGTAESMIDAANVYNSRGYRFCSVGFRQAPWHKFPAMADDAFNGTVAALRWMEDEGIPCSRIVVGGTSAGGHLAGLLAYAPDLQRDYDFPGNRVVGCISVAGVADAEDLLLAPFPTYRIWRTQIDLPTRDKSRAARQEALARWSPLALAESGKATRVPLFVAHGRADTLSPYASQQRFAQALRNANGDESVRFFTLEEPCWQHMNTTVRMYKRAVEDSPVLQALFSWLSDLCPQER